MATLGDRAGIGQIGPEYGAHSLGATCPHQSRQARHIHRVGPQEVVADDGPHVVRRHAFEQHAHALACRRPLTLVMAEVAAPDEHVHADGLAHVDLAALHDRVGDEALPVEQLARKVLHRVLVGRPPDVALGDAVHLHHCAWDPVGARLGEHESQVGVTFEDAAEHQAPQRPVGEEERLHDDDGEGPLVVADPVR